MNKKVKDSLLVLFSCLFFSGIMGCSSYTAGLKPTYPQDKQVVASLEPTLSWEDLSNSNSNYDVIIYERIDGGDSKEKIFYQENIEGTSLKIIDVLKPNKKYYWSVRERNGENVS